MKKLALLIIVGLTSFGCSGQKDGITIEGMVTNPSGDEIVLQRYGKDSVTDVAAISLKSDNTFSYTSDELHEGFYRLNLFDARYVNLILNKDDVHVKVDAGSPNGEVEITGSAEMDQIEKVQSIMQEFQTEMTEINKKYAESSQNQDQDGMNDLYGRFMELQETYSGRIKEEINNMGVSLAALQAVSYLDPEQDFGYIDSVVNELEKAKPASPDVQQIAEQMDNLRKLAIGAEAPDFTLSSTEGGEVSLSSFRGNYVLLDFWAAWCRPCRMENPNIVEAYNKYNDKGFEVFGVSLDQNEESWKQAIQQDGLPWTQVRDVKNEVSGVYNITSIPMNFLLDEEGRIIAKNLRGQALDAKLKELF